MWIEAAKVDEIAPGGIKEFTHGPKKILLCNVDGTYHAVSESCGHLQAPMKNGSLLRHVLTCPLHKAQFDVRTGKALSGPVPPPPWLPQPKASPDYMHYEKMEMVRTPTGDLTIYPVRVERNRVLVDL